MCTVSSRNKTTLKKSCFVTTLYGKKNLKIIFSKKLIVQNNECLTLIGSSGNV